MPFDSLRKVFFFKREGVHTQQNSCSTASTNMSHLSAHSPGLWSSTHEDFTCLRFFVWTGGDPGFTLTTAENDALLDEDAELVVERVTALKIWEAGIRPGDILETVGNKRVYTMDPEAAIVLVQMSKSPSIVRFRSPTNGKRVRFDVLHGNQNLGLSLTQDGVHNIPIVTRISSGRNSLGGFHCDFNSSTSKFRLGDILVAVNGMDAVAAGLEPTMEYISTCPRPVRLTFERAANDDDQEKWFGIQSASEQTDEYRRRSFSLRGAITNLAGSGIKARTTAKHRCREFVRSLMPAGVQSPQSRLQIETPRNNSPVAPPNVTCHDVHIEWGAGPLGLTLVEDVISGASVVNRLTGKGTSANMESLQHGFQLYTINGVQTEGQALEDLCRELLRLPKPVRLVFRPPPSDDTSAEDDSNSDHSSGPSSLSSISSSGTELTTNDHRELMKQGTHHHDSLRSSLIRSQHEYEVLWTTTRLGLKLEIPHHTRGQYPIVHKVLKESALDLPSDAVGHLLVCVNNWFTSGLSTTQLRTLLQVATKPAVLRFRKRDGLPGFQRTFLSGSSSGLDDGVFNSRKTAFGSFYSILWSEGELGITFGCYEDADQRNALVVYVKQIRSGQAKDSKLVAVGDILHSINGQDLPPKQKFKKTLRTLVDTKQPVSLGFRRLLVERCSDLNT